MHSQSISWIAGLSVILTRMSVAEYSEESRFSTTHSTVQKSTQQNTTIENTDYALSPDLSQLYSRIEKAREGVSRVTRASQWRVRRDTLLNNSPLQLEQDIAVLPSLQQKFFKHKLEEGEEIEEEKHRKVKRDSGQRILELLDQRSRNGVHFDDDVTSTPQTPRGGGDSLTLELAIFSDQTFYDYTKSRYPGRTEDEISKIIEEIIVAVVASVQLYFDNPSFGLDLDIKLTKIIQIDPRDLQPIRNIRQYLDRFCAYQRSLPETKSWDHALLLTGLDLHSVASNGKKEVGSSGMAYLSGMCSSQASCTISEARSLGSTALIISHELAHNLGADHDGIRENSDCDINNFIMGPKLSPGATDWSKCTSRQIKEFLRMLAGYSNGKCLKTVNGGSSWDVREIGLPGLRFKGEDQCRFLYGQDWSYYTGIISSRQRNSPCEAIWCRNGLNLRSPNAAALQGTQCGRQKVCFRGKCTLQRDIKTATASTDPTAKSTTTTTRRPTTTTVGNSNNILFPNQNNSNTILCDFFKSFGIKISGCDYS